MKKIFLIFVLFSRFAFSEMTLQDSLNRFGLQSFYIAYSNANNFVFSPFSLYSVLLMTSAGAKGETANEFKQVLFLDKSNQKNAPDEYVSLIPQAGNTKESYIFKEVNSMWISNKFTVLPSYKKLVESKFQAEIFPLSFSDPQKAAKSVNRYVMNQTNNMIKDLLSPGDVDPLTKILLLNATYFEGVWKRPFNTKNTQKADFYVEPDSSTKTKTVQLMSQNEFLLYKDFDEFQVAGLPMQQSKNQHRMACLFFLPSKNKNNPFETIYRNLNGDLSFSTLLDQLSLEFIEVKLPKFTAKNKINLNGILKSMGLENAFSSSANFSLINGKKDLSLSEVIQSALFSMDEKGVVAAAATAATLSITSAKPKQVRASFIADRPFVYFLVDLDTKAILFTGVYESP